MEVQVPKYIIYNFPIRYHYGMGNVDRQGCLGQSLNPFVQSFGYRRTEPKSYPSQSKGI